MHACVHACARMSCYRSLVPAFCNGRFCLRLQLLQSAESNDSSIGMLAPSAKNKDCSELLSQPAYVGQPSSHGGQFCKCAGGCPTTCYVLPSSMLQYRNSQCAKLGFQRCCWRSVLLSLACYCILRWAILLMAIDTEAPAGAVFIAASGTCGTGTSFGANYSLLYSFCRCGLERVSSNYSTTMTQARSCADARTDGRTLVDSFTWFIPWAPPHLKAHPGPGNL